jgi:hypothetical protein
MYAHKSTLLLTGFLMSSFALKAVGAPDSEQVSKLLSEAQTMSFQLKDDAATMESFSRMNVGWETHAAAINQVKDHVNALGKQAAKLQEAKATASPWQKAAIDRINPFLDELACYTYAVIEHIKDRKHNPTEYQDYLETNADYASDLAALIGNSVDYGKAKQRMDRLAAKLEIPATH